MSMQPDRRFYLGLAAGLWTAGAVVAFVLAVLAAVRSDGNWPVRVVVAVVLAVGAALFLVRYRRAAGG